MPSLKSTIVAALIASNLITASVAIHYKHQAKENLQDFWQASAEFERADKEHKEDVTKLEFDMLDYCDKRITQLETKPRYKEIKNLNEIILMQSNAIQDLQNEGIACQDQIEDLQDELSEQASTLRFLQPNLFTGAQASSYPIRINFDEMTQEEAEYAADVAEGQQN